MSIGISPIFTPAQNWEIKMEVLVMADWVQGWFQTVIEEGMENLLELARGLMNTHGSLVPILVVQEQTKYMKIGLVGNRNEEQAMLEQIVSATRPQGIFLVLNAPGSRTTDGTNGPTVETFDMLVCMAQTRDVCLVAMQRYVKGDGSITWNDVEIYNDSDAITKPYGNLPFSQETFV